MRTEIDIRALEERATKSEAACAELRSDAYEAKRILAYVAYLRLPLGNTVFDTLETHWQLQVIRALDIITEPCGQGWLSPENLKLAVEALEACSRRYKWMVNNPSAPIAAITSMDAAVELAEKAIAALKEVQ